MVLNGNNIISIDNDLATLNSSSLSSVWYLCAVSALPSASHSGVVGVGYLILIPAELYLKLHWDLKFWCPCFSCPHVSQVLVRLLLDFSSLAAPSVALSWHLGTGLIKDYRIFWTTRLYFVVVILWHFKQNPHACASPPLFKLNWSCYGQSFGIFAGVFSRF